MLLSPFNNVQSPIPNMLLSPFNNVQSPMYVTNKPNKFTSLTPVMSPMGPVLSNVMKINLTIKSTMTDLQKLLIQIFLISGWKIERENIIVKKLMWNLIWGDMVRQQLIGLTLQSIRLFPSLNTFQPLGREKVQPLSDPTLQPLPTLNIGKRGKSHTTILWHRTPLFDSLPTIQ